MGMIDVVITAFNQKSMVEEAVASVASQSVRVSQVVIVDDGSHDPQSIAVLRRLDGSACGRGRVTVVRQENAGVSAARNRGIGLCTGDFVVVLDGDDRLKPTFVERTVNLLTNDPEVVGASSWLRMFGVADALVKPTGGRVADFLARNRCPATVTLRREAWARTPGYDESMRRGFEDWEFFLTLLENGGTIAIVPEPLVEYRTAAQSANLSSMNVRRELLAEIMAKHLPVFHGHMIQTILDLNATLEHHLHAWETLAAADASIPLDEATFGDGGMAALVRAKTARTHD